MINTKYKLYNIEILDKWNKFTEMFKSRQVSLNNILPDHFKIKYESDLQEAESVLLELDKNLNYLSKLSKNQKNI